MITSRRTLNVCLSVAMVSAMLTSHRSAAADRPVHEVQIVASRFAFEPATVQVTAGEAVRLVVRSSDGTHGFAIPTLNIDLHIPKNGEPVTVDFVAPAAGDYEIACSEFCGRGHGQMKAALVSIAPTKTNR
jgi:cytochrome c oxidase subunit 2